MFEVKILKLLKLSGTTKFYFKRGPHTPRTKTQVKKIVSDIPPHTNQNIGIG